MGSCTAIICFLIVAALAGIGYLIWHFVGRPDSDDISDAVGNIGDVLGDIRGDFSDLFDEDPFVGDNTTKPWRTDGQGGLQLEILNALDETWQNEFSISIQDWENGDPDALTLTTTRVEVDRSCTQVDGVMKVCNNNFGETGWVGINEILTSVSTGFVVSSVAKMNEYYLRNAADPQRQFTMCHELGHGFGLPHTDEVFDNEPLGNCMDYTNQPEANMSPGKMNYERLASVYGTVNMNGDNNARIRHRRRRRRLQHRKEELLHHDKGTSSLLFNDLKPEYEAAVQVVENIFTQRSLQHINDFDDWKILEESSRGMRLLKYLGEDFRLEVHILI